MDAFRFSRRAAAGLGLVFLVLSSCRSVDAKVWNLRELHDAEGRTQRAGRLRNDLQHLLLEGAQLATLGKYGDNLFGLEEGAATTIEDPDGETLSNLNGLASFDADDPRVRSLQVEMFGWLAADDRYVLARERCFLELGPLGRRLGVERPVLPTDIENPADAEAVGAALRPLVEVVTPLVQGTDRVSRSAVEEACANIEALELDRNGLRRLLTAIGILLYEGKTSPERFGALPDLERELQARFIAQTFGAGLRDPSPVVRAAVIEAAVVASDNELLGLVQGALLKDPGIEVRLRCLELVERYGLPKVVDELSPEELASYEDDWINLLVSIAQNSVEGAMSAAACRALREVTDAPLATLRPEEWVAWHRSTRPDR